MLNTQVDKNKTTQTPGLNNYLALLASILSFEEDFTMQKYFDLYDRDEALKRMDEIKLIRENGGQTELEVWYRNSVNTDPICKRNGKNSVGKDIDEIIENNALYVWAEEEKKHKSYPVLVINHKTNLWRIYKNVKAACIDNHLKYATVRNTFYYLKTKQIKYKNYTFRKLI